MAYHVLNVSAQQIIWFAIFSYYLIRKAYQTYECSILADTPTACQNMDTACEEFCADADNCGCPTGKSLNADTISCDGKYHICYGLHDLQIRE